MLLTRAIARADLHEAAPDLVQLDRFVEAWFPGCTERAAGAGGAAGQVAGATDDGWPAPV